MNIFVLKHFRETFIYMFAWNAEYQNDSKSKREKVREGETLSTYSLPKQCQETGLGKIEDRSQDLPGECECQKFKHLIHYLLSFHSINQEPDQNPELK